MTPMMAQFHEIKAANPDCLLFYRMGDFYEMFFDDAEIASRALGIVLTKRGKHEGNDIPMCGVPIDRADDYLQRLIALGHRVAVCEQVEDPAEAKKRGPKSVVKRDVVRLVTPGTITEERLLDPARANILLALSRVRDTETDWLYGLAAVDISTGSFMLAETNLAGLSAEIARIEPSEIVAPDTLCNDPVLRAMLLETRVPLTSIAREAQDHSAQRRLQDWYGVATLDGLGAFSRAEIAAAAHVIAYIEKTQFGVKPALAHPARRERNGTLEIDAATRANLELTRTLSGHRDGSLLACIDLTVTPAGSRLLAERLASPLTDLGEIEQRLDTITLLLADPLLRHDLRRTLKQAPDIARALTRLAMGRAGPRDLAAMRDGLGAARTLCARLADAQTSRHDPAITWPPALAHIARSLAQVDEGIEQALSAALADDLPLKKQDGRFIRDGFSSQIDETRRLRDESRSVIADLQARYAQEADIRQLRIKHNNFLGFFIEVPAAAGESILRLGTNSPYVHRQTMADAMRFTTPDLAELDAKITSAGDRALALELETFEQLANAVLQETPAVQGISSALAALDVACALSELASARDWVRPHVDTTLTFRIEGARHPVVEAALKDRGIGFVANDCDLSDKTGKAGLLAIVTGPNMAGKSTFLRQNALIVILAQMGCYVPAARAEIGLVDRLFSRVGAADDLARGRSTFMVEMVETAAILNQATSRSLVILDEIGRGTATFDGLSIAWASVEHLHASNCARTLFATHFHELTQLAHKLPRLINLTMNVKEWNGDVIFLHEVVQGAADRSYGIQVAKLAGLPPQVVQRAQTLLAELEAGERSAPVQKLIDDLPLFAAMATRPAAPALTGHAQMPDGLRLALDAIDPDELTPRDALDALYRLKRLRGEPSER